jgi:signal transduction histidine kinase
MQHMRPGNCEARSPFWYGGSLRNMTGVAAVATAASGPAYAAPDSASNSVLDPAIAPLTPLLEAMGVSAHLAADPTYVLGLIVATIGVGLAVGSAYWAMKSTGRLRQLRELHAQEIDTLGARVDTVEAILASEPDALLIWSPDTLIAKPGTLQSRPRIAGSTAALADPATGGVDYEQVIRRLTPDAGSALRAAVDRLRSRGARFSLTVQSTDNRTFEAEGRPAGAQAVVWIRDVSGERAEISRFVERASVAERARDQLMEHLNVLTMPAWRRDGDGHLLWVNQAYVRAVEAGSLEDVIEKGMELVSDKAIEQARHAIDAGEISRQRLHTIISGERRALEVTDMCLSSGSAGIAVDVTELDNAEVELDRHIDAHGGTLDRLATPVAIFGSDKRLRFFNKAYQKFWDLDGDWLENEPTDSEILDVLRTQRRLPEQANFPAWKAQLMQTYQATEPVEEFWYLPDGQTVRMIAQAHPMGGVIYIYENVTERLNLESDYNTALRVQGETLDNLFEGVAVFGSDGRLKLHNPVYAEIWRLPDDLLKNEPHIGAIVDACRSLYDDGSIWDELKSCLTSVEARRQLVHRMERNDGAIIDCATVPLPDGATLITFVDVTDASRIERALRERNEALETADRLKSEFISHVSYQLRTPLTNIIGFGEILEAEMFGSLLEKQHEYTAGILESGHELLATVNDILDLSTIEAGAMTLDISEVSLSDVLRSAETFAHQRAQKARVSLYTDCPSDIGTIRADDKRIRQIMINLISNAISFTQAGDTITIGAHRSAKEMQLFVSDTGDGIKPEHQATVFDRFEARAGSDRRRGAGLGLSLVKSFVELHGGWVTLESEPKVGTRVTCHLPLVLEGAGENGEKQSEMTADR